MDNENIKNINFNLTEEIEEQLENLKMKDKIIDSKIEDLMIDLHNNCEFMGNRMTAMSELIKEKTDEEIKASTVNYRKAYDTLIKVAILISIVGILNFAMLLFILINH